MAAHARTPSRRPRLEPDGWRAMKPCGCTHIGRHRGPVPFGGCGSASAEVSNRIPAISMNAWPAFV